VNGLRKGIGVLLGIQIVLSAAAGMAETLSPCEACTVGRAIPAVLGVVLYSTLLAGFWKSGLTSVVSLGILLATAVHVFLGIQMVLAGPICPLCLAAAVVSSGVTSLAVAMDRTNLRRLACVLPIAGLAAIRYAPISSVPVPASADERVSIQVYTQPECPYCDDLRSRVMPQILKEFGSRVNVDYRSADDLPAVRRTPTLILRSGRAGAVTRILEGLPTVERLRGVIRDLESPL